MTHRCVTKCSLSRKVFTSKGTSTDNIPSIGYYNTGNSSLVSTTVAVKRHGPTAVKPSNGTAADGVLVGGVCFPLGMHTFSTTTTIYGWYNNFCCSLASQYRLEIGNAVCTTLGPWFARVYIHNYNCQTTVH